MLYQNIKKMKNKLSNTVTYSALIVLTLLISSFTLKKVIEHKQPFSANSGFVVLELFTSQGCSSCPSADAILAKYALQDNPNIIPLAFHVDYWNRLGWKDPFSKAQFSERQSDYAYIMNSQGNYTPQLIINGQHELVGNKESAIKELVNEELAVKNQSAISIKKSVLNDSKIEVEYDANKKLPNTVINVALVKKQEFTSIKRGENSGLKLTNYNIVFDFKTLVSSTDTASFEFKKEWSPSDFFVTIYLQNSKTGKILAAAKSEIK